MTTQLFRILVAGIGLVVGGAMFAADEDLVLQFHRMDLSDGRKLKNVIVRSYDAKSEKLLVIADGKAMTVPIALLPAPFNQTLKGAPASGGTVNTFAAPPRPVLSAADQYYLEHPAPVRTFAPVQPTRAPAVQVSTENPHTAQEKVARDRARRYYTYEFPASMTSHRVTLIDVELQTPQSVPGWTGRSSAQGKAYIELYDRRNRSVQRRTSNFEVLMEQKMGESLRAIDFTVKN
jgi:hypothetical protein